MSLRGAGPAAAVSPPGGAAKRLDQGAQRRRGLPARIIEAAPVERRAPCVQNLDEAPGGDVLGDVVLHHVAEPGAGPHGPRRQPLVVDDELAADLDPQRLPVPLELPGQEPAAADEAIVDADMVP